MERIKEKKSSILKKSKYIAKKEKKEKKPNKREIAKQNKKIYYQPAKGTNKDDVVKPSDRQTKKKKDTKPKKAV